MSVIFGVSFKELIRKGEGAKGFNMTNENWRRLAKGGDFGHNQWHCHESDAWQDAFCYSPEGRAWQQ
jgi:hypothetical protein